MAFIKDQQSHTVNKWSLLVSNVVSDLLKPSSLEWLSALSWSCPPHINTLETRVITQQLLIFPVHFHFLSDSSFDKCTHFTQANVFLMSAVCHRLCSKVQLTSCVLCLSLGYRNQHTNFVFCRSWWAVFTQLQPTVFARVSSLFCLCYLSSQWRRARLTSWPVERACLSFIVEC